MRNERNDKIECQICKKLFSEINSAHLKTHNMTAVEYKMRYPNVPTISDSLRIVRSTTMKDQWRDDESIFNSGSFRKRLSKVRTGEGNPFWNKKHTDSTKKVFSQNMTNAWKIPTLRQKMLKRRYTALFGSGENNPMFGKFGELNPFYGCHHTIESIQKFIKDRRSYVGVDNPNWRGGIAYEPYDLHFNDSIKERVRDRDNHTCQLCGILEIETLQNLAVHHIDYDKCHSTLDNLISLCCNCNSRVNGNRKYWENYFLQFMERRIVKNELKSAV